MLPFIYINVENQQLISDKLYNFVISKTNIIQNCYSWNNLDLNDLKKYVPELFLELEKSIGSAIDVAAVVCRCPYNGGAPHVDYNKAVRVLFPIKNCAGSYTRFYDLNGNSMILKTGEKGNKWYEYSKEFPLIETYSVELIKPIIFDSGVMHGVVVNPDCSEHRLTLTVKFKKDIRSHLYKDQN
jgi:hypothetical protein